MKAILSLVEDNGYLGSSTANRALDFWIWCGLMPGRWALTPDQNLWEEFLEEDLLYKSQGQCNFRAKQGEQGRYRVKIVFHFRFTNILLSN